MAMAAGKQPELDGELDIEEESGGGISITPVACNLRSASRIVGVATANVSASSRAVGRRSPGMSARSRMSSMTPFAS